MNPDFEQLIESSNKAAQLLRAMSNPHRLLILCLLNNRELSVSEINEQLTLSQSALSQHLAKLRQDGLVSTRRDAQTIYYSLSGTDAAKVIETLHGIYCQAK
jgi:ArsR family transcriptional regulator, virulence genes transcriptional regulator